MFGLGKKQKKEAKPRIYYSDILVNEPKNSWHRWGIKVLDYTYDSERLLKDRKSFKDELVFISVLGYISGLESWIDKSQKILTYHGIINLGANFPLYFYNSVKKEEIEDLAFHRLLLESGKSCPITMTGRFYNTETVPYYISPLVLRMGDYVSPMPKQENFPTHQ